MPSTVMKIGMVATLVAPFDPTGIAAATSATIGFAGATMWACKVCKKEFGSTKD
jgi:hypothetical protein